MASTNGWELWQTENAGSLGIGYARDIIGCLRYGKVGMYLKYDLSAHSAGPEWDPDVYYYWQGNKTITYYVAKTISTFIRPGAVQLRSVSSDSASLGALVAFYDEAASTLTVTLATGASGQTVSLVGADLPATLEMWVTDRTTNCVNQGDVAAADIVLPANSVVSLFGRGYTPTGATGATSPLHGVRRVAHPGASAAFYSLRGRRIGAPLRASATPVSSGVLLRREGCRLSLVLRR